MDYAALTDFLAELYLNNHKTWFEAHRPTYDRLRGEWLDFVEQIIAGIAAFDPAVGGLSPADSMFRIYRDVRFSHDKTPYKTHFSAAIEPEGRHRGNPAYYLQMDHEGDLFLGGGVWMPEPALLARIRAYIAAHPERLAAVLQEPAFAAAFGELDQGERLKRPPQGYEEGTPGIEWIKLKSFTAGAAPAGWQERGDGLGEWLVEQFRILSPLILWLRAAAE
jgi:uncharacterized protein (TIGR02453 family)